MPSKDVLKEAIKAFDGTAIIVSHDREFLDGLVTKVYEFGGGKVREYLGGIYDFLHARDIHSLNELENLTSHEPLAPKQSPASLQQGKQSYAEHKERQKRLNKAEKAVKESERKIERMEQRLKELDAILCTPEGASDMVLVTEYTSVKQTLDKEVETWERLSEDLEALSTAS